MDFVQPFANAILVDGVFRSLLFKFRVRCNHIVHNLLVHFGLGNSSSHVSGKRFNLSWNGSGNHIACLLHRSRFQHLLVVSGYLVKTFLLAQINNWRWNIVFSHWVLTFIVVNVHYLPAR